jgi:hypothetical protein
MFHCLQTSLLLTHTLLVRTGKCYTNNGANTFLREYDALGNPAEYQINKHVQPGNTSSLPPSFTLVGDRKK